MQSMLLWGAAAAAFATFAVHTFVGGVYVARPLLADRTLPKASKWLNYYCWHVTTLVILAMCGAFAYAATRPGAADLAAAVTVLAFSFSGLSVGTALKGGINPFRFPSTTLFAVTAALGFAGLV
ncbi:MAG: hypothetical protein ACOZAA_11730 [Pseudomonadota bacterium]